MNDAYNNGIVFEAPATIMRTCVDYFSHNLDS